MTPKDTAVKRIATVSLSKLAAKKGLMISTRSVSGLPLTARARLRKRLERNRFAKAAVAERAHVFVVGGSLDEGVAAILTVRRKQPNRGSAKRQND